MVAPMALPLTKIASLVIKTLSKPIASRIKHDASRSPLTQKILSEIGQSSHQLTSRLTIWSAGYKVNSVARLDDGDALKRGANILGESVVFLVSGGAVVWEYQRSKEKERVKEEGRLRELREENDRLEMRLSVLDLRLRAVEDALEDERRRKMRDGVGSMTTPDRSSPSVAIGDDYGSTAMVVNQSDEPSGNTRNEGRRSWWRW